MAKKIKILTNKQYRCHKIAFKKLSKVVRHVSVGQIWTKWDPFKEDPKLAFLLYFLKNAILAFFALNILLHGIYGSQEVNF